MTIQVDIATPPHRSEAVAEMRIHHEDGSLALPGEIYRENGQLMIAIYAPEGGIAWEFRVPELLKAIGRGMELME